MPRHTRSKVGAISQLLGVDFLGGGDGTRVLRGLGGVGKHSSRAQFRGRMPPYRRSNFHHHSNSVNCRGRSPVRVLPDVGTPRNSPGLLIKMEYTCRIFSGILPLSGNFLGISHYGFGRLTARKKIFRRSEKTEKLHGTSQGVP